MEKEEDGEKNMLTLRLRIMYYVKISFLQFLFVFFPFFESFFLNHWLNKAIVPMVDLLG